jgi:V8-like Glu-specific endopeptidase
MRAELRLATPLITATVLVTCFLVPAANAQTAPLQSHLESVSVDSGLIVNEGRGLGPIFSEVVQVPDATWLRLKFDQVLLGGDPTRNTQSYLVITSLLDGKHQYLEMNHVEQWQYTSAYFNGDAVLVEIYAYPGTGPNRIKMIEVIAGEPGFPIEPRSICGSTDDRELSDDPRQGRLQPGGCTAWMFDDCNHCFMTAGHCSGSNNVVEFNVPLSNSNGSLNHPGPEDQYSIDPASVQSNGGQGQGDDWAYFGCFANSNTGLFPVEAQGGTYYETGMPVAPDDLNIRVTGYGTVTSPVSPTWNQVQKTHVGPYVDFTGTLLGYQPDTSGGNSGSPVVIEEFGIAIGIHTHGGCNSDGDNNGTGLNHTGLQAALANPTGVCIPMPGMRVSPADELHASGDPGGPFFPDEITYTVENDSDEAFEYAVLADVSWVTVDPAGGTLMPDETIDVSVTLNATAMQLGLGFYEGLLAFSNVTTGDGDTTRDVSLEVGGPSIKHAFDLSVDPGWPMNGEWAFGQPTGNGGSAHGNPDPTSGYTGPNVLGVNLNGDHDIAVGGPYTVTLGPVDLWDVTETELRFRRWLNSDYVPYVRCFIDASTDGSNWTNIWENGGSPPIVDDAWQYVAVPATPADEQTTVWFRWGYQVQQGGAFAYSGWNIDDIEIWGLVRSQMAGDMNCDGLVSAADIDGFVIALTGGADAYYAAFPSCRFENADTNDDGEVSAADIDQFVGLLVR